MYGIQWWFFHHALLSFDDVFCTSRSTVPSTRTVFLFYVYSLKRIISLLLWIRCILPKAHSFTPHFRRQRLVELRAFAKNAKFDSAFSLKMLKTIRKRTVAKTALNLTPRFRRQSSAMLRAFGENGEWLKTLNIWANLKNIFENVGCTAFCIY